MPDHIGELLARLPELVPLEATLYAAVDAMSQAYGAGGKIMVCGNGGSAADAEHIVGELMKGFLLGRALPDAERERLKAAGCPAALADRLQLAIPALSLVAGISLPSAFANDVDAEAVFAQQVFGLGRPGDLLFAISTSGNSANVVAAAQVAGAMGIKVLALTGCRRSRLGDLADIAVMAPAESTPRVQELHLAIYHAMCAELEERLFGAAENGM